MASRIEPFRSHTRGAAWLLVLGLVLVFSCGRENSDPTGGETHFLKLCDPSADSCGDQLSCLCGVCTLPCNERGACSAFPAAACVSADSAPACSDSTAPGRCDVQCVVDRDCAVLSASHRCEGGACRVGGAPNAPAAGGASGSAGASGGAAEAGASGMSTCAHGEVPANQVLLIGDSFFASSHQIAAYLEELARTAGAISAGERYRDNSRLTVNALALAGNGIKDQYDQAVAEAQAKVVIMNGGGADVLVGSCQSVNADCPLLVNAAAAATSLLGKMAEDGVQHVVYAFYPDPVDEDVRAKMDALRPLIQSVCASSPVPCEWLDLRGTFAGQYGDYVQPDGLNPTDAGSRASAGAIWATMRGACIAQ